MEKGSKGDRELLESLGVDAGPLADRAESLRADTQRVDLFEDLDAQLPGVPERGACERRSLLQRLRRAAGRERVLK